MPKSKRGKKNSYLTIEGHTLDEFKSLSDKKIIPFFKQVQKNSKHYQEMSEGPKKEELFDLYYEMYSKYYENHDKLPGSKGLPGGYRNYFDPGVIFGKVKPDYY